MRWDVERDAIKGLIGLLAERIACGRKGNKWFNKREQVQRELVVVKAHGEVGVLDADQDLAQRTEGRKGVVGRVRGEVGVDAVRRLCTRRVAALLGRGRLCVQRVRGGQHPWVSRW